MGNECGVFKLRYSKLMVPILCKAYCYSNEDNFSLTESIVILLKRNHADDKHDIFITKIIIFTRSLTCFGLLY